MGARMDGPGFKCFLKAYRKQRESRKCVKLSRQEFMKKAMEVWQKMAVETRKQYRQVTFYPNSTVSHDSSVDRIANCLSSLWPGFNSKPRRSISRDFSLADHILPTCFYPAR